MIDLPPREEWEDFYVNQRVRPNEFAARYYHGGGYGDDYYANSDSARRSMTWGTITNIVTAAHEDHIQVLDQNGLTHYYRPCTLTTAEPYIINELPELS